MIKIKKRTQEMLGGILFLVLGRVDRGFAEKEMFV